MAGKKKKVDVKGQNWDIVVAGLGKKFGKGLSLFRMDSDHIQMLAVDALPTNLLSLDNALGVFGFPRGRIIEIYGPESGGKAQPLTSKVLTPSGFRLMEDIEVGSIVCTPDGGESTVIGIYPQGRQKVYQVILDDKTSARCTGDHLWLVQTEDPELKKVLSTDEIIKKGYRRFRIPQVDPRSFKKPTSDPIRYKYIESIEPAGIEACQCIKVGHPDQLYITDDFIVTHNTSLALQAVISAQLLLPDKPILYVDLEHALDPAWMKNLGVNFDNLWISQPDSGEEATQIIVTAIESGAVSLVVLDSVAAVVPQAELDGEMTDKQMGKVGAIMGKFCRKIISPLQQTNTTFIAVNQTRMKLGPMPGEERPGGKALRFFASQILRVRKESNIKNGEEINGVNLEITVRKNKVAPPFRVTTVPLMFDRGFSKEMSAIEAGVTSGLIDKAGTWYSYNGLRLGQGVANASKAITEDLFQEIYNAYKKEKMLSVSLLSETDSELELENEVVDVSI